MKNLLRKLKRLWCRMTGHRYEYNHVGVISCARCGDPWIVE